MKKEIVPFLKWAGGKRWFVQSHADKLPRTFNRYIEPFLGGGSVYFYLKPRNAILGDLNPDVVAAYQGIKENWQSLRTSLLSRQKKHSDEYFYKTRAKTPASLTERAARMIYLNRTCFNGIYRVNRNGQFNVPRGSKNEVLLDSDDFKGASDLLADAVIRLADFEVLINEATDGDLIFADPPYTVRHNYNGFVKYNEVLFSWADQERLAKALIRARERGAQIVATNANHHSVRGLYDIEGFELHAVSRFSSISAAGASRRQFEELVILANTNKRAE
ncbi:DNA adenine methylase [Paraburkholderia dinghuensis]|uniref:Site-specific DNA-methyltransferase (adenine-specific) n=1 Tax=Paraburkholderia dinghuensis TaxID=2305225 RepID=A0A3N6N719_9BURK|nr:Dam family site-specific DNA-(adenine-N6)-methyltransferase [Paraburkholderia dinghuensis]RQH04752.1 Dam family site-specific DNA-(adenine-N6)-methyltransferase [Paraburkholderia dinghuensis]